MKSNSHVLSQTLVPPPARSQTLADIDGRGFLNIRSALRTLRNLRPALVPAKVRIIEAMSDPSSVVIFEDATGGILAGLPAGRAANLWKPAQTAEWCRTAPNARKRCSLAVNCISVIEKATLRFGGKLRMRVEDYRIKVIHRDGVFIVIFDDPERPPDVVGSWKQPGFEVTLDPKTLEVLKSHFIR